MNTFSILVFVLLAWASFYAIYLNFVRPVILTRFRFRVAEVRDNLDLLLLAGKVHPSDESFKIVKRRAIGVEGELPYLSITNFLYARCDGNLRTTSEVREEHATIRAGNVEVKKLSDMLDTAVAGSFAANSPMVVGIAIIILVGCAVFFAFARGIQTAVTDGFWSTVYFQNTIAAAAKPAGAVA